MKIDVGIEDRPAILRRKKEEGGEKSEEGER